MNSTEITYDQVEDIIEDILERRARMQAIYDDFNHEVGTATNEASFAGSSRDTVSSKYSILSTTFPDYCNLIQEFAEKVRGSKDSERALEVKLAEKADAELNNNHDLTSI